MKQENMADELCITSLRKQEKNIYLILKFDGLTTSTANEIRFLCTMEYFIMCKGKKHCISRNICRKLQENNSGSSSSSSNGLLCYELFIRYDEYIESLKNYNVDYEKKEERESNVEDHGNLLGKFWRKYQSKTKNRNKKKVSL